MDKQIADCFLRIVNDVRDIKSEAMHIGGDPIVFGSIFKTIGDSFDMLRVAVQDIGMTDPDPKPGKEESHDK